MSQLIKREPSANGSAAAPRTTTGATAAVAVDDLLRTEGYTIEVKGVGSGGSPSVTIQSTIDGSTWTTEGSPLTADGRATITAHNIAAVRVNIGTLATPGVATSLSFVVAGRQSPGYGAALT
jgi:hypothetical protein